ncbi:MAG: SMP-30/gluconolactonase/LRE family protein [Rhodoferax sp.]|uniref:SMP-30/gluconolactonase/LRE family protein n=1 Tax=Rhodoferax sp. TaxID=50421 RepID=UPI00263A2FC8|nr:SMP-30/gluconolactonase/LRE family protein [Rhodoferax sp.]MDD2880036.1 SMP-30/gluconolactonase/LRE family protein [Rhodoferax sp.]
MTLNTAYSPEVWQTVTPHVCALGESPFWHPHEQMLYWVDISGKQILRANIYMGTVDTWDMPSEPGCMAPAASGGLVLALRDGVFRAPGWGGPLTRIATLDYDPAVMRANDGKCDALGRFWVGTIDETRTLHNAGLYCVDARAGCQTGAPAVTCKISPTSGMTTANGLAFSPDNRTLYWANTPSHTVWAWDHDLTSNTMTAQREFASFKPKPADWLPTPADANNGGYRGRPDGAAVDVQGNYWVAMFEGRRVCQFAPDGTLLAEFSVPLQCPTMPCFGGEDLKTLYITSARHHRSPAELAAFPLSGQVLSMRVDVAGLPVNFFVD